MPPETSYCRAGVITVPATLHCRLKYSDKLPFFQMIAKNVGIRRARGQFILATNIDIVFSDELIQFISRQDLNPKKQYRVDRYDIQNGLSAEFTLDETLDYAWSHLIRTHRRYRPTKLLEHLYGNEYLKKICIPDPGFPKITEGVAVVQDHDVWQLRPARSLNMSHLHTNACGDFTLLSREGWHAIKGYPEFEAFSFNVDSIGMLSAHYAGYEEVSLLPPCVCFHIEHGVGSGWTPEGEKILFNRLRDQGILNPEWPVLMPLVNEMRAKGIAIEFNRSRWGLADFDLPEQALEDTREIPAGQLERLALQAETHAVSAIQPAYDLDRLTLAHERRLASTPAYPATAVEGPAAAASSIIGTRREKVVFYLPDSNGRYSEARSVAYVAHLNQLTTLSFRLQKFAHQFPLRFDPCQGPGLINITAITIFDIEKNKLVLRLDGRDEEKLVIGGTAVWANRPLSASGKWIHSVFRVNHVNNREPLYIISTGLDPQVIFPPLPKDIGFPLIISIEMQYIPSA
jgi:hypothetical protein